MLTGEGDSRFPFYLHSVLPAPQSWHKAAVGGRSSPNRWARRRLRNCSAFTPTCPAYFPPTFTRQPRGKRFQNSSTTITWRTAGTLRRGSSRKSCRKWFARDRERKGDIA